MVRAFVGVPLCEAAVAALLPVQEALGQGRMVDEDNLHLTLAFLDDQPQAALAELNAGLEDVAVPVWDMEITGVAARGGRRPALIWAEVARVDGVQMLHAQVRRAARMAGIDLPRERFRPHVTLARFGRSKPLDMGRLASFLSAYGGFRAGPFIVDRFCLYASTLAPEGPVYEVLAEYALG